MAKNTGLSTCSRRGPPPSSGTPGAPGGAGGPGVGSGAGGAFSSGGGGPGSSDRIAVAGPGQDQAAQALGVAGGDAGDGGVGAGRGGVHHQPGQADGPLDRPLGHVDVLDPEVRDSRVDTPDHAVAQLEGVGGDVVAPVPV